MYPWRRILVPTDFSTASQWAFDDAAHLAGATGAELVILHIRMTRTSRPGELRFPADVRLYEYAEQHELEMLRERVRLANATVETRLVVRQAPDPGSEIARVAADEAADLIVIATHARHHIAHFIIGSTTIAVLNAPPAPVLAIRYGVRKRKGAFRKIVVPLHAEQTSDAALQLASAIAARVGSEIHLVSVAPKKDVAKCETLLAETAPAAKVIRKVLEASEPDTPLIDYCHEIDADALFINAGGRLGSVKQELVRRAGVPVMIVP